MSTTDTRTALLMLADAVGAHTAATTDGDPAAVEAAAAEVLRLIGSASELGAEVTALRRSAARALSAAGWTATRIAALAGVTRSAISQLLGVDRTT